MEAYLDTSEFLPDFIVRMSTVRTRMDKYIAQVMRIYCAICVCVSNVMFGVLQ